MILQQDLKRTNYLVTIEKFIKHLIFKSLDEGTQKHFREVEEICQTIKINGDPWTNPIDNTVIESNRTEIDIYDRERQNNNLTLNNRFNALLGEFQRFIINRNKPKICESHQLVLPTRKSIG